MILVPHQSRIRRVQNRKAAVMLISIAAILSLFAFVFGISAYLSASQIGFAVSVLLFWIVAIPAGALFILGAFVRQHE